MPLGIVSDSDLAKELDNCSNSPISAPQSNNSITSDTIPDPSIADKEIHPITAEIVDINRGRGLNSIGVPESLRKIIGEAAITSPKEATELAKSFGISRSSVSAYTEGAHSTSTINKPNSETKSHIDFAKMRISKRASKKLMLALDHLTDEKLANAKAGEIAIVARSMAGVLKDMTPDTDNGNKNNNDRPLVIFAPVIRNENSFETVTAKE